MRTTDGRSLPKLSRLGLARPASLGLAGGASGRHRTGCLLHGLDVLRFLHRRFRSQESNATVGTVTERLGYRPTTAAERKRRLAGQVVLVAIGVDQFNRTLGRFHPVRTIFPDRDLDCSHETSGNSCKKIAVFEERFQFRSRPWYAGMSN